jgi:uncharacterized membrane protein
MAVRSSDAIPRLPPLGLIAVLLVLAGFALWYIAHNVFPYATYDSAAYNALWPRRFGLIPHILGGTAAILAGLVQLWLGLTGRVGVVHRTLGRIYVAAIAVASSGAIYRALTIPSKYFAYGAGLFSLACTWIVTTSMALFTIRRGAIEQHREWMLRSYIVTFAFVTFRFVEQILLSHPLAPEAEVDSFVAFACWSLPLLLAEP